MSSQLIQSINHGWHSMESTYVQNFYDLHFTSSMTHHRVHPAEHACQLLKWYTEVWCCCIRPIECNHGIYFYPWSPHDVLSHLQLVLWTRWPAEWSLEWQKRRHAFLGRAMDEGLRIVGGNSLEARACEMMQASRPLLLDDQSVIVG